MSNTKEAVSESYINHVQPTQKSQDDLQTIVSDVSNPNLFDANAITKWYEASTKPLGPTRSKRERILVSVDIEKAGGQFANPVISVGFYVGDEFGKELRTLKVNFNVRWPTKSCVTGEMNYYKFEKRCWDEFWVDQQTKMVKPELYKPCVSNPSPVRHARGWNEISSFLNALEVAYPSHAYKIIFVSDNASYDIANIDYGLEKFCNRRPMRFSSNGDYRSIMSPDDMMKMVPSDVRKKYQKIIDANAHHNHDAIEDAKYIYWQAMCVI